MQKTKQYWPLTFMGINQIGTAIFFLLPKSVIEAFGLRAVNLELSVYLYVVCAFYFTLGVLFLLGTHFKEVRFAALIILCVDAPLEAAAYFAGFPHMSIPYWIISLFGLCIIIPGAFSFFHLKKNYSDKFHVTHKEENDGKSARKEEGAD
jgi:hypothetical protein